MVIRLRKLKANHVAGDGLILRLAACLPWDKMMRKPSSTK